MVVCIVFEGYRNVWNIEDIKVVCIIMILFLFCVLGGGNSFIISMVYKVLLVLFWLI